MGKIQISSQVGYYEKFMSWHIDMAIEIQKIRNIIKRDISKKLKIRKKKKGDQNGKL